MDDAKVITDPIKDKTSVVVGTRPGIIKMSPLIEEFQRRPCESFTIHAGQHYSDNLDAKIFEDLGLDRPEYHLENVKEKQYHGEQTAAMLEGIEAILLKERPENVLVCGDANFNLAGALATRKLRLTLGHVEAGLRSDDWRMPEEHNRVMIDHISDHLFAPTKEGKENALEDNVQGKIHVTGNTVVDAVQRNLPRARQQSKVLDDFGLTKGEYIVFTAHREENVDDEHILEHFVSVIETLAVDWEIPLVYPIHPRTCDRLEQFGLDNRTENIDGLHLVSPLGYLDFLKLVADAKCVLTDSGGVQEESCIMQVPCVTLRENTERPETVEVGANVIAGVEPSAILEATEEMMGTDRNWENPFGDGNTSQRIADILLN